MTIPVYVVGAASLILIVYLSDKYQRRGVFIMGCCVPVAAGYLVCVATPNQYAGYAGMFILVLGRLQLYMFRNICASANLRAN
jgi:MFS family permease